MILSEQDAMNKRCQESFAAANGVSLGGSAYATAWNYPPPPFPGAMGGGAGGAMGIAVQTAPLNCIGGACMAWRWLGWRDQNGTVFANSTNRSGVEHVGYCGKAGAP